MNKTFRVALSAGILAMIPLAYALFSNGGVEDGTFHGWMGNGGRGMAFGIDGRPENTGFGFFAACLALYLTLFLLPVWLLKRLHHAGQDTRRTIRFLPLDASYRLADSGETIGRGKPVMERKKAGGLTFRPSSFL